MRYATIDGTEYKLNERDYAQLLRRFDLSRAKNHRISIRCICHDYVFCKHCPFDINNCYDLLEDVVDDLLKFAPQGESIDWSPKDDTEARAQIQKVRDVLLSAERR